MLFVRTLFLSWYVVFFFNDTATTEIYTLSLHDALPISADAGEGRAVLARGRRRGARRRSALPDRAARRPARHRPDLGRSEEHTSELQSRQYLVCRLLLEKKKNTIIITHDLNT